MSGQSPHITTKVFLGLSSLLFLFTLTHLFYAQVDYSNSFSTEKAIAGYHLAALFVIYGIAMLIFGIVNSVLYFVLRKNQYNSFWGKALKLSVIVPLLAVGIILFYIFIG